MIRRALTAWLLLVGVSCAQPTGAYWIGNSLTWDTMPLEIPGTSGGTNQYHVDCGVGLDYIYLNPDDPCVGTSTLWTTALTAKQFAAISFQPHGSDAFETVVTRIEYWMDLQPSALVIIHTSWAGHATHATEYVNPDTSRVWKSAAFMDALQSRLQSDYPTRRVVQTYTHAMLYDVAQDIAAETAPAALTGLDYLYRDDIHLTGGGGDDGAGYYLSHNAMRRTLGLPYAEPSVCTATAEIKAYLRQKIEQYHGPIKTSGAFR